MSDVEDDGLPSCEEGQGRGGGGGGGEESNAGSSAGSPAALSPPPSKGCLKVLPERRSVSPSRVRILEHQNIVSFGGRQDSVALYYSTVVYTVEIRKYFSSFFLHVARCGRKA